MELRYLPISGHIAGRFFRKVYRNDPDTLHQRNDFPAENAVQPNVDYSSHQ